MGAQENNTPYYSVTCSACGGYLVMPTYWHGTSEPKMCSCIKSSLSSWECIRCRKINSPYKESCDCHPNVNSYEVTV
jgi:hypothetical protein